MCELGFGGQRTNRHQGYAPSLVSGKFGYPSSRKFRAHVREAHIYCPVRWRFLSQRILPLLKLKIMPPRYDAEYQSQGRGTAGASRLTSILVKPWAFCGNSERCTVVVRACGLEMLW
ncbi:uncharacterized protein BKA55DRAFT_658698 [Fusarium redolens]|uniref:Uncharacterized protein n=1 Tax=Fusarium redolens TaxID=48865 RepID=A0A9P9KW99_FUSRE|nr:uncharacterized protein BKA55DRAFT_658698 [Fusarium redolens]KAH7269701.1 hypothetical protein BKA55DRAFT_658698 [Fusarium redolens]